MRQSVACSLLFLHVVAAQAIAPGFDAAVSLVQLHAKLGSTAENRSHVVLIPSAKLAFCLIPKIASDAFTRLFLEANGQALPDCTKGCNHVFAAATPGGFGIDDSQLTKEHGWKFAYFLRDPLERYLSAFGSKCVPHIDGKVGDNGANCEGEIITTPGNSSDYVEPFEKRVLSDLKTGLPPFNPHWVPQTQHIKDQCGSDLFNPDNIDFVGTLDDDVNAKVKSMLKLSHAQEWMAHLVDKFFPPAGANAVHASTTSKDFNLFFRDPKIVQDVANLYEEDFAVLNLKRSYLRRLKVLQEKPTKPQIQQGTKAEPQWQSQRQTKAEPQWQRQRQTKAEPQRQRQTKAVPQRQRRTKAEPQRQRRTKAEPQRQRRTKAEKTVKVASRAADRAAKRQRGSRRPQPESKEKRSKDHSKRH